MIKRDGAHDEDYDMLVIGRGWGGRIAALQLAKKNHSAETRWDVKRFAWAPLGLKGTRPIFWLPKVVLHAGVAVADCSRVLQRMWRPQEHGPSHSLEGLPWHEFIQRVAAAEAAANRADESSGGRHS